MKTITICGRMTKEQEAALKRLCDGGEPFTIVYSDNGYRLRFLSRNESGQWIVKIDPI